MHSSIIISTSKYIHCIVVYTSTHTVLWVILVYTLYCGLYKYTHCIVGYTGIYTVLWVILVYTLYCRLYWYICLYCQQNKILTLAPIQYSLYPSMQLIFTRQGFETFIPLICNSFLFFLFISPI